MTTAETHPPRRDSKGREVIYRHTLAVRVTHWVNLLCITLLLMSGLQIFNAHPRLYWGQYGANPDRAFVEMIARRNQQGELVGETRVAGVRISTNGVLAVSRQNGVAVQRGFPSWATLPSSRDLGNGRRWHFFFAWLFAINGALYFFFALRNRHVSRDLALTREELKPKNLLSDIWHHAQLKTPRGEASKRYNPVQKLAYLSVLFGLLPLMILTGLTMSPGMNAAFPFLLDIFGGRQSARTLHFLAATGIVLFVAVHVFEVFLAGVINEVRSMITGWYTVKPEAKAKPAPQESAT